MDDPNVAPVPPTPAPPLSQPARALRLVFRAFGILFIVAGVALLVTLVLFAYAPGLLIAGLGCIFATRPAVSSQRVDMVFLVLNAISIVLAIYERNRLDQWMETNIDEFGFGSIGMIALIWIVAANLVSLVAIGLRRIWRDQSSSEPATV